MDAWVKKKLTDWGFEKYIDLFKVKYSVTIKSECYSILTKLGYFFIIIFSLSYIYNQYMVPQKSKNFNYIEHE